MHEIRTSIRSNAQDPVTPVARKSKPARPAVEGLGALTKVAIRRQEARVTDQRCEDRHFNLVEHCVVVFRRRKHDVRVVNVSSRGAMIVGALEPRIGERLDIQFSDQNRTRCIVRWVRENRIGLEFVDEAIFWDSATPTAQRAEAPRPEEPRDGAGTGPRGIAEREPRQTLLRNGALYWSGISIPVRLRNISSGGARVDSQQSLRPGLEVELDLGEAGFQAAEVRWCREGQVGLRFAGAFDLDALAASLPAGQKAQRAPDVLKPAYLETETRADSPWAARFERLTATDLKIIHPED